MNPSQTRIALLVSLLSLGWSSAAAASETQVPGPLAPPEPATPFGVASWPENWSFELAATARSAHGDNRLTAPEKAARRPASRFKTRSVPVSFQDYSPEGERYVCLDGETGVLARATTGCRVPVVLSEGALAAATGSPFFASVDRDGDGEPSAVRARAVSQQRSAAVPFPGADDGLSTGDSGGRIGAGQARPGGKGAAAANEDVLHASAIRKSTIRADLSGFHDECPFSLPSATELAEVGSRAATVATAKAKAGGKRSAAAPKSAKKVAAAPEQPTGRVTAAKRTASGTANATPAKRRSAHAPTLPDPFGNVATDDHDGQARQRGESDGAASPAAVASAQTESRSALSEAVRSATQAIADLSFVHEEDPFLLSDATTSAEASAGAAVALEQATAGGDAQPSAPSARPTPSAGRKADVGRKATAATPTGGTDPTAMQAAERGGARVETTSGPQVPPPPSAGSLAAAAAPLAAIDSPLLPELNGAYPFWLPGDIVPRKANGRTRGHGGVAAGVNGGRRTVIEAVPVEVHGVPAREGVAAAKEGSGAAVVAESTAEAKIDGAAGSSRRPSALDGEAIEVYGALADEYAAAVKETGHASAAAAPTTAAATGDVAKPRQPSVLDDETIEVYGVLADEYAAAAAEEAIRPAAAEIDEQRSRLRVEVETAAVVGRATVDLLAAIEQWAAEFVKAGAPLPEAVVLRVPDETAVQGPFAGGTVAIAEADLDGVRGGFDNGNGLRITFGIERAVYINGNLVTTTNFNVADLGKVTGGQAAPSTADKPGVDMVLIQNGPGNVVHPGIAHSTAGTVIQNTLNNQNINSVTLVNATVNSVQLFKGMDLQSMLRSAVNAAVQR